MWGGTFTDVVATDDSQLFTGKVASRPNDEAAAVLDAVRIVAEHFGQSKTQVPDRSKLN
jgi:N-methylhydantoinase A